MRCLPRTNSATELGALAEDGATRSEEQVFDQLLRKRGPSTNAAAFHIVFSSDFNRVPIESMMLVEARVFRSDDSMLEIGRDLAQRNEFVSFVIRRVVNPGLQAALHVHCGGRRVDPPGSHEDSTASDQRSATPTTHHRTKDRRKPFRSGVLGCVYGFSVTFQNNRLG
jgi:hypothetical protein